MSTVTLVVGGVVFGVVVLSFLLRPRKQRGTPIPSVPGYPIIRNLLDVLPDSLIEACERNMKKYGPIIEVYAITQRMILVADPALCKEILNKRPKVFRRVRSLQHSADVLGLANGLFHTHGPKWSRIRKLTSPTLAKHHIVNNLKPMIEESLRLVDRLTPLADGKTEVNIKEEMFQYTLRLICLLAFGLTKPSKEFSDYFLGPQFAKDLMAFFEYMMASATFPLDPKWFTFFPGNADIERRALAGDARFNSLASKIVEQKRRELAENPNATNRFSVIDILVDRESQPTDVEGGEITDSEIVANVKIFFVAGSDTTSIVLTWAVFFFCQDKNIVEEVRVEANRFFAAYKSGGLGSEELLNLLSKENMPLTNAVVKETARLYGPAPMNFVELESTTESCTLSNGMVIEPFDEVIAVQDCVHWNEKVFKNPKSFLPKRWLQADAAQLAVMEGSFMAFGHGPRVCPGMTLAFTEAVIGVAALVHHFDFELACSPSEVKRIFRFVAQPNQMPVHLKRV